MSKAIAVVEDDESIREMLRYYFQSVGYAVRAYESGEALFAGEEGLGLPALYILDIMLPGMDGLEILRRLREGRDTADVPVIMLTARSAEMDRVAGLENGADDYVVKPFGIMELQARVKAVLRRTERRGDRVLTWGDVELDPAAREVHKAGKPVELTYKEFELLKLLFPAGAWPSPGTRFSRPSGTTTTPARPAPWICTSRPCAKSWARTSSPQSGAWDITVYYTHLTLPTIFRV